MAQEAFEWRTDPDNVSADLTFGWDKPYLLTSKRGVEANVSSPMTERGPFQRGVTPKSILTGERVIRLGFTIIANTRSDLLDDRNTLIEKLAIEDNAPNVTPNVPVGELRYSNPYGTDLAIDAIPQVAPLLPPGRNSAFWIAQSGFVEFLCPDPMWKELTADSDTQTAVATGTTFNVSNDGHLSCPVLITFTGEVIDPILKNNTTGEEIGLDYTVAAGDTFEIDTSFGLNKRAEQVSGGNNTDRIDKIKPAKADFFYLRTGTNELQFDHSSPTATVKVEWYPNRMGI